MQRSSRWTTAGEARLSWQERDSTQVVSCAGVCAGMRAAVHDVVSLAALLQERCGHDPAGQREQGHPHPRVRRAAGLRGGADAGRAHSVRHCCALLTWRQPPGQLQRGQEHRIQVGVSQPCPTE